MIYQLRSRKLNQATPRRYAQILLARLFQKRPVKSKIFWIGVMSIPEENIQSRLSRLASFVWSWRDLDLEPVVDHGWVGPDHRHRKKEGVLGHRDSSERVQDLSVHVHPRLKVICRVKQKRNYAHNRMQVWIWSSNVETRNPSFNNDRGKKCSKESYILD